MIRHVKEYKLNEIDDLDVKIGTINRLKPSTFYVVGKTWITPLCEMDYNQRFGTCWKEMENRLKRILIDKDIHEKHIIAYDINFNSMLKDNSNYLCFDITLKQKSPILQIKDVVGKIREDIVELISSFEYDLSNNNFRLQKNRR